jgi:hypothetical protein
MSYSHVGDIDPDKKIDAGLASDLLGRCVARAKRALLNHSPATHGRDLIDEHLRQFRVTHHSIMLLLRGSDVDHPMYGDAMSLAREQIEKVFVLVLLNADPEKWSLVYLKYGWKKLWEAFLLEAQERKNLQRFDEFYNGQGEEVFDKLRIAAEVTREEKEAIEDRFWNQYHGRNEKIPAHLADHQVQDFPMPRKICDQFRNHPLQPALERWYQQWRQLSDYSHVGADKITLAALLGRGSHLSPAVRQLVIDKEVNSSFVISCVATAFACTEVCAPFLALDIELAGALAQLWHLLDTSSLLGKLFWDVRAKSLLPGVL